MGLRASPLVMSTAPDHAMRLRHLWTAYLLAMVFHVDLGLMPLFHGRSPQIESQVPPELLPQLFWAMLLYFLVPLLVILACAYAEGEPPAASAPGSAGGERDAPDGPPGAQRRQARLWRRWRALHGLISVFYTLTNIPHLIADILVPDSRGDQVMLMLVLLLIGLLINREAWLWWRQGMPGHLRRSGVR